jgi:hypothetical protein
MAGSLTWRQYLSDTGVAYSIMVDKSNANIQIAETGEVLCEVRGANFKCLPKMITPRIIYAYPINFPRMRKAFIVGNRKCIQVDRFVNGDISLVDNATGTYWVITGYRGEKIRDLPTYWNQIDTGLTDGTTSQ